MQTPSVTPARADACTGKPSRLTAALVSPEVAKLLHKLQGQIIKEASTCAPAPGEVVLNAPGKSFVQFFTTGGAEVMEIMGGHGAKTTLYREYQPHGNSVFVPGVWWGNESRTDAAGERWSHPLPRLVCNDFGDLVEVAV